MIEPTPAALPKGAAASGEARLGLRLAGAWWLAPAGAVALAGPPLRRRLPGGGWLGLQAGGAVPVLDPGQVLTASSAGAAPEAGAPADAGPLAWLALPGAEGPLLLVAEALLDPAPAEAAPWPAAWLRPTAALPPPPAPLALPPARAAARPPAGLPRGLALESGAGRLVLPSAAVERILPWAARDGVSGAAIGQVPGAPAGAVGYRILGGAPALLLDPAWCGAAAADAWPPQQPPDKPPEKPPEWLVLFAHAGRRLALPADRVRAVDEAADALLARLAAPYAAALMAAAPALAEHRLPPAEPQRVLLLCRAGGQGFALAVEEVAALLPSQLPMPWAGALGEAAADSALCGICNHRGTVLPVLDAGRCLGGPPVLRGTAVPLLRLLTEPPVALAIARVGGLARVPASAVAATFGAGLVAAVARLGDAALPVLRAAALAAAGSPLAAAGAGAAALSAGPGRTLALAAPA